MATARTIDLLRQARVGGYGVGAFNVIGLEHAQAIVRAAEEERAPVVLQLSQNSVAYNLGDVGPIGLAMRALAEAASVPAALHLDHVTTRELCERALDTGFSSVMFDASARDYAENVSATREMAAWLHERGASLEAELGVVGGKEGLETTEEGKTDPEQAGRYVQDTGADSLAVAIGTTHYMVEQSARIDLELISRIREQVGVPLVLHGSSGVPDEDLREAVRRGIAKVNIATQLNKAFTRAVREHLARDPSVVDPRPYLTEARDALIRTVRERIRVLGSAGAVG